MLSSARCSLKKGDMMGIQTMAKPRDIRYVYIAAPMRHGDLGTNIRRALDAADGLVSLGFIPYVPHLCHFWNIIGPKRPIYFWFRLDEQWIRRCDALIYLPGKSSGVEWERKVAKTFGIPVYSFRKFFSLVMKRTKKCPQ